MKGQDLRKVPIVDGITGEVVGEIDLTPSKEFQDWWNHKHPEKCKCGVKIEKYDSFINDVAVCENCMREATKHMIFK